MLEVPGVEKSALYQIRPDNTVETIWTSTEENAYDLTLAGDRILFTTDDHGRVYELAPDRKVTLLTQTGGSEATRLLRFGRETLVATSNMGKVYRLGEENAPEGSYEAPVHDATTVARGPVALACNCGLEGSCAFRDAVRELGSPGRHLERLVRIADDGGRQPDYKP